MKRWIIVLAAIAALASVPSAQASIVTSGSAAFAIPLSQGPANYPNYGVQAGDVFTLVAFNQMTPGTLAVTNTSSYLNVGPAAWGDGIRWDEQVVNGTASTWHQFTVTLSGGGTFYTDQFAPALMTLTYVGGVPTFTQNSLLGSVTVSPDGKTETFFLTTAVGPGQGVVIHTPIFGLTGGPDFTLTETPSAVPEPVSLAIWSTLGCAGAGAWALRRRNGRHALSNENRTAIYRIIEQGRKS